jgi:hypothetical protein
MLTALRSTCTVKMHLLHSTHAFTLHVGIVNEFA